MARPRKGIVVVAKTSKTRKEKGRRLERKVAAAYREYKIDDTARPMPMSGAISHFKGDIYKRFDFDWIDECKNHETVRLSTFWEQTVSQGALRTPVLHVSGNHRPIVTLIRESDFDGLVDSDTCTIIDITDKKRFQFWEYAAQCTDAQILPVVVYLVTCDEALVMMDINVYMRLRKEASR